MHPKFLLPAGFFAALLCGVAPLHAADVSSSQPKIIEQIIAKVNGEIITQGELEHQRAVIEAELRKDPAMAGDRLSETVKQKQADALREQIDQLLLVQRAKDLSINVDAELSRQMLAVQSEAKIADPEAFHKWVAEQTGMPFEDFKNLRKNSMLQQRVMGQEVYSKVQIPKAEVRDYYDKHKADFVRQEMVFLREILIGIKDPNDPASIATAEKRAKDIAARARKGEKFNELARTYSDAPTAQQDGELGSFKRGELRKDMEEVVFKANKGYVTDPVRSNNGFVILKVEERYEAGQAAFEDVQNQIMDKMMGPKVEPEVRKYLTKLREDAFIEIRGGYVDSGAAPGKDTSWKDPATLKPQTTTKEEVAAHKKKKFLGVIPRHNAATSSSSGK